MSTLKVNNLQDINGANNSTPEQVAQGRAKAWVNFDGAGTLTSSDQTGVRDSFNISSVIDVAAGVYTVNIDTDMSDTNYVVVGCVEHNTSNNQTSEVLTLFDPSTKTVGSFKVRTGQSEQNVAKDLNSNVVVFGD